MGLLDGLLDSQFQQDVKRGLLDAGNRGFLGGLLGAPVDMATMALRPFGYSTEKPVGGSEWIGQKLQDAGLVSGNRNTVAEVLASIALPGAAAKAAPKLFAAEQAAARNLAMPGPSAGRLGAQRGIFGGVGAETAPRETFNKAAKLDEAGVEPAAIWRETGWAKGPDGKWRFEIDDSKAKLVKKTWEQKGPDVGYLPNATLVPDAMRHSDLYKAYPDIRNNEFLSRSFYDAKKAPELSGSYSPYFQQIEINAPNAPAARSGLLHELQHAVQEREGFARGGGPNEFNQAKDAQLARDALSFRKEVDALGFSKDADWIAKENAVVQRYHDVGAPDWLPSAEARNLARDTYNNPNAQLEELVKLYGLDKNVTPKKPMDLYRSLAGEAEARLVQQRMNMTPAQRAAQFPFDPAYFKSATGVPLDDLIFAPR
jgi:hypothetical protein